MKVYLAGSLEKGSSLLDNLKSRLGMDVFDPTEVEDNNHGLKLKKEAKLASDFCLYIISPKMHGFEHVINVVDDSNKRPGKTGYCYLPTDDSDEFTAHQLKSLKAIGEMVKKNGGRWFENIDEAVEHLNAQA